MDAGTNRVHVQESLRDGILISILSALDPHEALSDIPRFLLAKEDPVQLGTYACRRPADPNTHTYTHTTYLRGFETFG